MKKILILSITALLLVGCKKEIKTDYTINGNAEGVYNGIRVYLKTFDFNEIKEKTIDTAIVMNEKFSFVGKVENPELRSLIIDNIGGKLSFIIENNTIDIRIDKENIAASTVSGSIIYDEYRVYYAEVMEAKNKSYSDIRDYKKASRTKNLTLKDSLSSILAKNAQELAQYPINFALNNADNYLSLLLVEQEVDNETNNIKTCKEAFDNLDIELKNSTKGRELGIKINALFLASLKTKKLEIGEIAPNFEAPTPDGTIVSLNDLKGKVTIIDFWAAWSGPCRRENPNVVRMYNQYHDKGLEIIGVSLDGQSRQNDPKKAWLEAIEKDQLTWTHVSYLKYFNDPIAQLYNINSIPATYILDKDGKIAYKNLRGKALELKVKELLAQ